MILEPGLQGDSEGMESGDCRTGFSFDLFIFLGRFLRELVLTV
jgi:hypothetical protein